MQKTKLAELLKTFSKSEFKEFEKFILSPYFNNGRDLLPFYNTLKSFYPNFDGPNFTKLKVFKILYPKIKFERKKSENILRVLSSEMFQLGREFLKQEEFKSQTNTSFLIELKSLRKRNLNEFYSKLHSKVMKECDLVNMPESDFFLEFHQIHKDSCKLLEINNSRDIQDMISLFNYFLLESGKFIFGKNGEQKNNNDSINNNFIFNFFKSFDPDKFLALISKSNLSEKDKDLIKYFTNYIAYSMDQINAERLENFENSFYKVRKFLGKDIKFNSYASINSYYTVNIDMQKLNAMFRNLMKDDLFDENPDNRMHYLAFRGIFRNFMEVGEKGEALNFLENYRRYLNPEISQQMYDLCIAELEVVNENYKKALDHISGIEISTFFLKYDLRNLLLKIYFYLNHYEEARYLIQSYRKFLTGNAKVPDEVEKRLLIFLNYYEKLFSLKLAGDKKEIKIFQKEFEDVQQNSMWFKKWVENEIKKLVEKKHSFAGNIEDCGI